MSKYDFEIDLSDRTSTGIIIHKIKPGSRVLEFGCAEGRMTRHMAREMGCRVWVVEYDPQSYAVARQEAQGGVCGDIMDFAWEEAFRGMTFDAIIFADVLEHLYDPALALGRAAAFLAEGGAVYVSVPNLTHNDILLKAAWDRVDYTAVGILDDTHRHFWGLENLPDLARDAGLTLRALEATYCDTYLTEQYGAVPENRDTLLENILRQRPSGEIYQFILTLDKDPREAELSLPESRPARVHVYPDTGSGFSSHRVWAFEAPRTGRDTYQICWTWEDTEGLQRLRLDPVEDQYCLLRHISVTQDGEPLSIGGPDLAFLESGLLMLCSDPRIELETRPGGGPVLFRAELVLPGSTLLELLCRESRDLRLENTRQAMALEQMEALRSACEQAGRHNADLESALNETLDNARKLEKNLSHEIELLRVDVGAYILLADGKDRYAMELERACTLKDERIRELQAEVDYFHNLRVVRLRAWVIRKLRGVKRRIWRILGRGE